MAEYVSRGIIDMVQLHGHEDELYISRLRELTSAPVIQAFRIGSAEYIKAADSSTGDYILLDSGAGSGRTFDHDLIEGITRPYFLAGGLDPDNAGDIISRLHPFAADASSSLETNGFKDIEKMKAFVNAIRRKDE